MTDTEIGMKVREIVERGNSADVKPGKDGEILILENRKKIVARGKLDGRANQRI